MSNPPVITPYETIVAPEWIDYSGHMNLGYYLLVFEDAARHFLTQLDVSEAYRGRTNHALFATETHIVFERELREGDPLRFESRILGATDKAIDGIHMMYHASEGYLAATNQVLYLHVDLARRRAAAFPADAMARVRAVADIHATLPRPPQAGRAIALRGG